MWYNYYITFAGCLKKSPSQLSQPQSHSPKAYLFLLPQHMVGGYKKKEQAEVANFETNLVLASAIEAARVEFRSKNNGELGNVIEVYEQVVAGLNYKMIFQT